MHVCLPNHASPIQFDRVLTDLVSHPQQEIANYATASTPNRLPIGEDTRYVYSILTPPFPPNLPQF